MGGNKRGRPNLPNGVSNTDSVHTDLVDGAVDGEEVDKVAAERVLGGETDLLALRLDVLDNLDSGVLDVCDVLAVAVLHQVAAGADNDIDTVNTGRDGQLGIVHVTSHVSEDLGLEAELADLLAVEAGLLTGGGRGELNVVDAKVVEGLGNLDLGSGVEEGVGELLALAEGGLDDLELGDVAQEVADGSVGVAGVGARGLVGLECSAGEDEYAVLAMCCLPARDGGKCSLVARVIAVGLEAIGAIAGTVAVLFGCWAHVYGSVRGRASSMDDGTKRKSGSKRAQ